MIGCEHEYRVKKIDNSGMYQCHSLYIVHWKGYPFHMGEPTMYVNGLSVINWFQLHYLRNSVLFEIAFDEPQTKVRNMQMPQR